MHSVQDPSKKSSITSLLNPDVATNFPIPSTSGASSNSSYNRQQQPHPHQAVNYANSSSQHSSAPPFELRVASWNTPPITHHGESHANNGGHASDRMSSSMHPVDARAQYGSPARQLHTSRDSTSSDRYLPSSPEARMSRPRATSIQSMLGNEPGRTWQNTSGTGSSSALYKSTPSYSPVTYHSAMSNGSQNGHHNSGIVPPHAAESQNGAISYTDRRPDEHVVGASQSNYRQSQPSNFQGHGVRTGMLDGPQTQIGYQDAGTTQPHAAAWQSTERASVRLAARGTVPLLAPILPHPGPNHVSGVQGSSYSVNVDGPSQRPIQPAPSPPQSSSSSKRQLPESEASTPKAKRPAKAKAKNGPDGTPLPSKRGFNAKKRSEAARIAAQNTVGDRDEDHPEGSVITSSNGQHSVELQFARCMSNRYRNVEFPRCVSCTRRWAGDTCRFQNIRRFVKENQVIVGVAFHNAEAGDFPEMQYPKSWNTALKLEHVDRTKKIIAKALLPIMQAELAQLDLQDVIRRVRETDVRVTCDTCMTSIFSASWMCRVCGRESCADCYNLVRDLTEKRPGATAAEEREMQKRREKYAHNNPFFLACTKRTEHDASCFSPMTRFFRAELEDTIEQLKKVNLETADEEVESSRPHIAGPIPRPPAAEHLVNGRDGAINWVEVFRANGVELDFLSPDLKPMGKAGEDHVPPNISEATATTPYYKIPRYSDDEVTAVDSLKKFAKIWALGEPLLVGNILSKFKSSWTPDYFTQEFGDRECLITECEVDANEKVTVRKFFSAFGKYEDRSKDNKKVWKLKDWPPSADFKTDFPDLYKDFSEAVPVPDYIRRDGVYNIGSHFATNVVAPDLGPKMYNAWAAEQKPGSRGSTRLHMDMADALNIMLHAAPCPDGSPGCAIWDIYRAEDSDKIRSFLKKHRQLPPGYDPIHSQQCYLDDNLRSLLYKEYGVLGYRIYQRPGEAIFIPAACAHQVSNLSDSIKIATDFVSLENLDRCAQLTKEFREQNKSKVWKEDVLQLKTMMWHAWHSACRQDKILRGEPAEDAGDSASASGSGGTGSAHVRGRSDNATSQSTSGAGKPRSFGGRPI